MNMDVVDHGHGKCGNYEALRLYTFLVIKAYERVIF